MFYVFTEEGICRHHHLMKLFAHKDAHMLQSKITRPPEIEQTVKALEVYHKAR